MAVVRHKRQKESHARTRAFRDCGFCFFCPTRSDVAPTVSPTLRILDRWVGANLPAPISVYISRSGFHGGLGHGPKREQNQQSFARPHSAYSRSIDGLPFLVSRRFSFSSTGLPTAACLVTICRAEKTPCCCRGTTEIPSWASQSFARREHGFLKQGKSYIARDGQMRTYGKRHSTLSTTSTIQRLFWYAPHGMA